MPDRRSFEEQASGSHGAIAVLERPKGVLEAVFIGGYYPPLPCVIPGYTASLGVIEEPLASNWDNRDTLSSISVQVVSGFAQQSSVVSEPTKAVVAGSAKETAQNIPVVAVVEGQSGGGCPLNQRFWSVADGAPAILFRKLGVPPVDSQGAVAAPDGVSMHVCGPLFRREGSPPASSLLPKSGLDNRVEVLNAAVTTVAVAEPYLPWHGGTVEVYPDYPANRDSMTTNVRVTIEFRGLSPDGVPVPGNRPDVYPALRRRVLPTDGEWDVRVVREQVPDCFLRDYHGSGQVMSAGGGNK